MNNCDYAQSSGEQGCWPRPFPSYVLRTGAGGGESTYVPLKERVQTHLAAYYHDPLERILPSSIPSSSLNASSPPQLPSSIPCRVDAREMDALIAKEMNELSLQERERTYEEIHGVQPIVVETPILVQTSLEQFRLALSHLPPTPAYTMALAQSAEYLHSQALGLMFLRGTDFQPMDAAQKCMAFLQDKLELFGVEALTRRLTLSDMSKDDLACLKSGAYQLLPTRDSAGRCVLVDFHLVMKHCCYKEPRNLVGF